MLKINEKRTENVRLMTNFYPLLIWHILELMIKYQQQTKDKDYKNIIKNGGESYERECNNNDGFRRTKRF